MKSVVPILLLPVVFLLALGGLYLAGDRARENAERDWAGVSRGLEESARSGIIGSFARYQDEAVDASRRAASAILALAPDSSGRIPQRLYFAALSTGRLASLTLEYYDSSGVLTAWDGPAGPDVGTAELDGRHRSFLDQGPIYSYLVLIVPVFRDDRVAGHVVGKRLFTVNHPLNNRFISSRALAVSFQSVVEEETGTVLEFRIPEHRSDRRPALTSGPETGGMPDRPGAGRTPIIVPLRGIDGSDIGYVMARPPEKASWLGAIDADYRRWRHLALIGFMLSLIGSGARVFRRRFSRPAITFGMLGSLWAARYAMIALELPAAADTSGIPGIGVLFDPSLFASSFGYGAARSLGDMVISAVLLAVTFIALFRSLLPAMEAYVSSSRRRAPGGALPSIGAAGGFALLAGLLGPLTRGFYAVVRSVVFDSRIDLNDPGSTFPGVAAGSLLLGGILLVFSIILGGMLVVAGSRAFAARLTGGKSSSASWLLAAAGSVVSSVLFDLLHPNPLGTLPERLIMIAGLFFLALLAVRRHLGRPGAAMPGTLLVISVVSAAVLIPALDSRVHEHDKELIQAVVRDLAKPEDAWMEFLLNESLTSLSDTGAAAVLRSGDARAMGKLAFGEWARSILAAEGNTCSVTFVDVEGSVVSHFHVGPAPHWSRELPMDEMPRSTRLTTRESRTVRGRTTPWYKGYAPVFDAAGRFSGGVWAGIAPNTPEKILGQEQDLLTVSEKYDARTPVRNVILAEYTNGRLLSASGDELPFGRSLPASLDRGSLATEGAWVNERFGRDSYDTYYLQSTERTVVGVSLQSFDAGWHFYSYSRYILFFMSLFLVCWGVYWSWGLWRAFRTGPWHVSFRTMLIAAFAVVSVIPVLLLAWYNRQSLQQEAERATDSFLKAETDLVLNEIEGRLGMAVPYELARYTDESLEEIAGILSTQVHLYDGAWVQGSSRPDLLTAELVDRRLPAGAFSALYLSGWNFYAEEQTIGSVSYLVGYRPIRSQSGEAIGAVAVPSLSRQGAIEEDLARRDVILYGIYIIVLGISLLVGTGIANRIARPVRRLTAAARRVATGDLDVRLETGRPDELGELETAFQGMTADLRGVQEKMVKVERELAWKEMAKQVAHEIKNPLTPMRLSIQHLVSSYQKGAAGFAEVLKTVSTTVLEQIDALSRIASEFSAFARLPARKIAACDIHAVINEAAALYHREGVRFATSFVPGSPSVRADREELRRAFINIIRNSVQAAKRELSIGVSTRTDGEILTISITDDGPGMTPEVLGRLFEPNFSTKTDGMGIGLTIVKKTVEDLDGTISVESAPGKGTTVRIRMPLSAGDAL